MDYRLFSVAFLAVRLLSCGAPRMKHTCTLCIPCNNARKQSATMSCDEYMLQALECETGGGSWIIRFCLADF